MENAQRESVSRYRVGVDAHRSGRELVGDGRVPSLDVVGDDRAVLDEPFGALERRGWPTADVGGPTLVADAVGTDSSTFADRVAAARTKVLEAVLDR